MGKAQLELGDVVVTIQPAAEGGYQGKVIVAERVLRNRAAKIHICPEVDVTRRKALRRAMKVVDELFPLAD